MRQATQTETLLLDFDLSRKATDFSYSIFLLSPWGVHNWIIIYVRFYKQPKLHEKKLAVAEEVEEVTNQATNSDKDRYFNSIVYCTHRRMR